MLFSKIFFLFLIIFSLNCSTFNQTSGNSKTNSTNKIVADSNSNAAQNSLEWEVIASNYYGRFHQFGKIYQVNSSGKLRFEDKEKKINESKESDPGQIKEISEMLEKLDLASAKSIPDGKYNQCIVSMHLPNVGFTLKQNGKSYRLTHCNNGGAKKEYQYTLVLNDEQKELYSKLREKIISLVEEHIPKN